jgi:hypothetical protein
LKKYSAERKKIKYKIPTRPKDSIIPRKGTFELDDDVGNGGIGASLKFAMEDCTE